jgi:hypothetical protein
LGNESLFCPKTLAQKINNKKVKENIFITGDRRDKKTMF